MRTGSRERTDWLGALRCFLGVSIAAHFFWEILQLPLYSLWTTGTVRQLSFAVLHCTAGDAMIAALSLLVALLVFARPTWPATDVARVYMMGLALGLGYTIYSEWVNTSVRGSWAYSGLMPIVPVIGTGLAPLMQWFVVPTMAMWITIRHLPWRDLGMRPA